VPARLINIKYITIRAEKVASPATALQGEYTLPDICDISRLVKILYRIRTLCLCECYNVLRPLQYYSVSLLLSACDDMQVSGVVVVLMFDRLQSTSETHREFEPIRFLAVELNTFRFPAVLLSRLGNCDKLMI